MLIEGGELKHLLAEQLNLDVRIDLPAAPSAAPSRNPERSTTKLTKTGRNDGKITGIACNPDVPCPSGRA